MRTRSRVSAIVAPVLLLALANCGGNADEPERDDPPAPEASASGSGGSGSTSTGSSVGGSSSGSGASGGSSSASSGSAQSSSTGQVEDVTAPFVVEVSPADSDVGIAEDAAIVI